MAITTFTPPLAPAEGSSASLDQTVVESSYGDNYSQRATWGVNTARRSVVLQWPVLSNTDADTIEAYIGPKIKAEAFYYTAPPDASSRKWTAQSIERVATGPVSSSIVLELREEFDL